MDYVLTAAIIIVPIIIIVYMKSPPSEEVTDDYFKIAGTTVWLKDGMIENGGTKMDVNVVSGIAIEPRGFPSKVPTVVVYFNDLTTTELEVAQYTTSGAEKANTVMRKLIVAIEKAGGPKIVMT